MHSNYLSPAIRQLRDQQVRFAPHERQIQQADSAEKLLNELDPKRTYSCKYVCHRVTNNGYESDPDLKFTGKEARHDLRLFVEDLSDAARVPVSAVGERVLTIDELARQDVAVDGPDRRKTGRDGAIEQLLRVHSSERCNVRHMQGGREIDAELLVRRHPILRLLQLGR